MAALEIVPTRHANDTRALVKELQAQVRRSLVLYHGNVVECHLSRLDDLSLVFGELSIFHV